MADFDCDPYESDPQLLRWTGMKLASGIPMESVGRVLRGILFVVLMSGMTDNYLCAAPIETAKSRGSSRVNAPTSRNATVDSTAGRSSSQIPRESVATGSDDASRSVSEKSENAVTNKTSPLPNTMDGLNDTRPLIIGDTISINIIEDESAPRSITVTDSGEIDAPYIGRVPVQNRSCKKLAYYLKKVLEQQYYYQATVIVGLDSAGAGSRAVSRGTVYVQGQVKNPGSQEIPSGEPYTVGKAILRAGGWGPYADRKKVKLVKGAISGKEPAKPQVINGAEIVDKGHWEKDVEVGPNDSITVPERIFNLF
jgi:polysaccharide biosynthesis/export protein